MNNKGFHIKITDNENGNIVLEADTAAIIGALSMSDNIAQGIGFVKGNAETIANTLIACDKVQEEYLKKIPILGLLKAMSKPQMFAKCENGFTSNSEKKSDTFDEFLRTLFGGGGGDRK